MKTLIKMSVLALAISTGAHAHLPKSHIVDSSNHVINVSQQDMVNWTSKSYMITDNKGGMYTFSGDKTVTNAFSHTKNKVPCIQSNFFSDPTVTPDFKKELPSSECFIKKISNVYDAAVAHSVNKKKTPKIPKQKPMLSSLQSEAPQAQLLDSMPFRMDCHNSPEMSSGEYYFGDVYLLSVISGKKSLDVYAQLENISNTKMPVLNVIYFSYTLNVWVSDQRYNIHPTHYTGALAPVYVTAKGGDFFYTTYCTW